jgi:hypothetical protein
MGVP